MTDKIAGYIAGEFEYEGGSLVFSCSKIEVTLDKGTTQEGSFLLKEQSGQYVRANVYSSNNIITCQEEYEGEEICVSYQIDTTGKISGDVIKGEFQIISDMGEYVIPYVVSIRHEVMESSMGNIKNLFHFTNLAKSNFAEAVTLFYQKEFISILNGHDARYRSLYRGLCTRGDRNRNVDEFLIGVNKKKAIEYTVDTMQWELTNPKGIQQQLLHITKKGWGYLQLTVKKEGSFLALSKEVLSEDDFLGNLCEYPFYIKEEALHAGNNYGRLFLVHAYGSIEVTICVRCKKDEKRVRMSRHDKRMQYSLTRYYLDFRKNRLAASKWMAQSRELVRHRRNIDSEDIDNRLFEAHLLLTQEHYSEAKYILDGAIKDPLTLEDTRYCYYLYLTALYNADEFTTSQVAERIDSIYKKDTSNWRIAWLLLYLPGEYTRSKTAKWNFILQQLAGGCISPIMYQEGLSLLNKSPSLLIYLQKEQLRVLLYGAKEQSLSLELMQQVLTIAGRCKEYHPLILKLLIAIYDKLPQNETLRVICMQLMKGQITDKKSFVWYEKGIRQNLPITRLYEYYMMSMDVHREQEIEKNALLYFSYECTLPAKSAEYLYHYVVKNKEMLGEIYEAYVPQIERFLLKQLYAGRVNGNLAYLYQEIVLKDMATPDNICQFAEILFLNKITVMEEDIVSVIVLDDRLQQEMEYPISAKSAMVPLFSSEHTILLEDKAGCRYYGTREYQTECYFFPRRFLKLVSEYAKDSVFYNLFACGENREMFAITDKNAERCQYLLKQEVLETAFCQQLQMNLITYYFEHDDMGKLSKMLEEITAEDVLVKKRSEIVKYLSIYGFSKKAYEFTLYFGAENVEAKSIVRFSSRLLEEKELTESSKLTCMLYSAFERGKYNESVLRYLIQNYRGLSKHLRNIFKAALDFDMDTHAVCERLLCQTLSTGAYVPDEEIIYTSYVASGAKTDINRAFLSYKCYEYLIQDKLVEPYVFEGVGKLQQRNRTVPFVCMLAYLRFYSQSVETLSEEQKEICIFFLHHLYVEKRIVMPFFAEYRDISKEASRVASNVLIEYRGNPKSSVMVHYIISRDGEEESSYIREEMKNMFSGIFVKEFLLFYGESLQYYVTESYENREQLTESGTIHKKEELLEASAGRYAMINNAALSMSLQDYATAKEVLNDYARQEFIMRNLFTLQ